MADKMQSPVERHCPIETVLSLIGGKYKSLILWSLINGCQRYSDLQRFIPCATPKVLAQHLRELEKGGLISRSIFPVVPPRVEYSLTELGISLVPVLYTLYDWGLQYMDDMGIEMRCPKIVKPSE